MKINQDVLDSFYEITSIDVEKFISDVNQFTSQKLGMITSYYKTGSGSNGFVSEFDVLFERFLSLEYKIDEFSSQLSQGVEYFELVDIVYKAGNKLYTIKNLPRWLRSSYDKNFGLNKEKTVLKQNQSIESLAGEKAVNWEDISVDNFLSEKDYDLSGGNTLTVSSNSNALMSIESIVDNMVGDNLFGKDIDRSFVFEGDDLKHLSGEAAINQAADINLGVVKGSVPEFINIGVTKSLVGSPLSVIMVSSLMREIQFNFKLDDLFDKVVMKSSYVYEDSMHYEFLISTKVGFTLNKTV